ncbi:MAG: translation initiation factor IF-2 [Candidatus Omnitrophota bacterium]|jgi:translation initiation factor IF-2
MVKEKKEKLKAAKKTPAAAKVKKAKTIKVVKPKAKPKVRLAQKPKLEKDAALKVKLVKAKEIIAKPHPIKLEPIKVELSKPHLKVEAKVEVKLQPKVEVKPQAKAEVRLSPKVEVKPAQKPIVAPLPVPVTPEQEALRELEIQLPVTLKDLAIKLQEKPSIVIKQLMDMKVMAGINQNLDEETAAKICRKFGCKIKKPLDKEEQLLEAHQEKDKAKDLLVRAPIVTFMGHVDHGKTSLLDAIRKTKVADSEHGGITQHIGAYRVKLAHGEITFLDTPGHEAFTAMRARGARITDIVVLVVAADDGIMPQTQEAIDHSRAAGVPIIVAMNKIDKPGANPDKVKKQLQAADLKPEEWGGKTITVPVSAKTGEGIDNLLEMIILEAQMLELKANPKRLAKGVVVEAKMSKGRGPVATLLIENGTLHLNENIIVGNLYGKIRAMFDDHAQSVTSAGPGFPVEVLGISGVPEAGEQFFVIADEKEAKELAQARLEKEKQQQVKTAKKISLEDLHAEILAGKIKELKIIIKSDVQGSLEAIKDTLAKLNVSEIKVEVIHTGVGNVNSSDVVLAVASNALIVGFNIEADDRAKELISKEGIDFRTYNIIYELANDIKAAVEGMLAPKLKRVFLGRADVRKVFKLSRSGTIAGCYVTKGKINRNSLVNLIRNGEVVFEGKLSSLKRFKDDIRDVAEGFECGMSLGGYDQMIEGDIIEAYEIEKIARKLE